MPNSPSLRFVFGVYLNSQEIQAKENELVMPFEPFFYICAGLDQCQGTVHDLSGETDDILLKASVDPLVSLSWVGI